MAQTASVERAATADNHPLPPTPVSEEVKEVDWPKRNAPDVRPGTPNSMGHDADFVYNREVSEDSIQHSSPPYSPSTKRKPAATALVQSNDHAPEVRLQEAPASPVNISPAHIGIMEAERASVVSESDRDSKRTSRDVETPDSGSVRMGESVASLPIRSKDPSSFPEPQRAIYHPDRSHSRQSSGTHTQPRIDEEGEDDEAATGTPVSQDGPGLHYHAFPESSRQKPSHRVSQMTTLSNGSSSSGGGEFKQTHRTTNSLSGSQTLGIPPPGLPRPASAYTLGSEYRGRTLSPLSANGSDPGSPLSHARDQSSRRRSPLSSRPQSYVELLANVPYNQQVAPASQLNNESLQSVVGSAASLLDTKKTLEMYRANVKKTKDAAVQYEFAIFMLNAARDAEPGDGLDPTDLQNEAKHILQTLSDRAYPFAQYYLADGYFSGLFNKGKPDYDKAFPLFVAGSKHGHAEAGYRAALCYEFGWGTARSGPKAVQFYKASASKNHPGAATRLGLACLNGDMGLDARVRQVYRDGVKWLKRAQESADPQYNQGPFELGLLHLEGYGNDIFKDEAYAAQLLTQAAELGHVQANFMMGQAYENGLYSCPRDAALSVHFYNGAATRGHVEGMMALCAWYMVGAEPILERDENEAYAWAKLAAETGKMASDDHMFTC